MIYLTKNEELFELHKKVMVKKIRDEINNKVLKFVYLTISKEKIFITPIIRKLLEYFEQNVEKFVLSNISVQKLLINDVSLKDSSLTKKYEQNEKRSDSYKIVKYIFETRGYDELTSGFKYDNKSKEYGAYKFVKILNLKTCPYCNRNYISMIEKESQHDKQRRPDLDHFHPKSIFPFLAVNFYNLIPSCSTCNKLKSDDISLKLIHPYDSKVNDMKITYWLNGMEFYHTKNITFDSTNSIDIEIENMPEINKQIFQVERLYQEHKDIVIELILKRLHYPSSYIKELSDFGYSKKEIYRFVFSNYLEENEFSKRPLAKLTKDIAEELGLLDYIDNEDITS